MQLHIKAYFKSILKPSLHDPRYKNASSFTSKHVQNFKSRVPIYKFHNKINAQLKIVS